MEQIIGEYRVYYKNPNDLARQPKTKVFEGVCENFAPSDKLAFRNKNDQMLVVRYADIIQMMPIIEEEQR